VGHISSYILGEVRHVDSPMCSGLTHLVSDRLPQIGDIGQSCLTDLSVEIMILDCSNGAAVYEEGRSSRHGLGLAIEQ
jgi:hypothetical protein